MRKIYWICDQGSAVMICLMILAGPWMFGTTHNATIWAMTLGNGALGALLFVKILIRSWFHYSPERWDTPDEARRRSKTPLKIRGERFIVVFLAIFSGLVLAYIGVSAWNYRAIYRHDLLSFDYRACISWLPHSYDAKSTWFVFWQYLGLALFFWSVRDWLMTRDAEADGWSSHRSVVPKRLRNLLVLISVNAILLALEAIAQRLDGTDKLLWLIQPRINSRMEAQFGPYAYRSNAAQYFNLIWPVSMGLISVMIKRGEHRHKWLPWILGLGTMIMATCPIVSAARGGIAVGVIQLAACFMVFAFSLKRIQWRDHIGIACLFVIIVQMSLFLGWNSLVARMHDIMEPHLSGRTQIYAAARQMAEDYPVFGTGPGTFAPFHHMYRNKSGEMWQAYVHNDWLETRLTFGWIGFSLIMALLFCALSHWFIGCGIPAPTVLVATIWISLGGCFLHAVYDFPLQIYSILSVVILYLAILSSVAWKNG